MPGLKKLNVACYSTKLDMEECYEGVAALYYAYNKALLLIMGYSVIIHTHHEVTELVEQGKFVFTVPRTLQYLALLTFPDVTIVHCNIINLANNNLFKFEGQSLCPCQSLT